MQVGMASGREVLLMRLMNLVRAAIRIAEGTDYST